jgi:hypothetical protein
MIGKAIVLACNVFLIVGIQSKESKINHMRSTQWVGFRVSACADSPNDFF